MRQWWRGLATRPSRMPSHENEIDKTSCWLPDKPKINGLIFLFFLFLDGKPQQRGTYGANGICQVRVAEDDPSPRGYAVRFVIEFLRPQLKEITEPTTQISLHHTFLYLKCNRLIKISQQTFLYLIHYRLLKISQQILFQSPNVKNKIYSIH